MKIIVHCAIFLMVLNSLNGFNFEKIDSLILPKPIKILDEKIDSIYLKKLQNLCGKHKKLPKGFEYQALIALSYYPELYDAHIKFIFRKSKISHTSRPSIFSMLNPFQPRRYVIRISNEVPQFMIPMLLENMHFNAQVGVLGHELAHTLHYHQSTFFQIIKDGLKYSNEAYKTEFELATDFRAIEHNLGYQLKAWSIIAHPILKLAKRDKHYLRAEQIEELISKKYQIEEREFE